jgi:hypothetical protein|tara:strand:- start:345 stop:500 length:156 start_codon:yes stop_codon:yes gene_type:complete
MNKEKKIYYSDLTNYVDVCYSCKSQNIDLEKSICKDCKSEDVGSVPPEEVI